MKKVAAADDEILDGPTLYPVFSWENLHLLLWVCFVMWFNCSYPKLMDMVYDTEHFHFFDHVIKVLLNYFSYWHVERSLLRNLVFNTLRCMPDEFIIYAVHGVIDPPEVLVYRMISIWALTIAVQYGLDRRAAQRHPNAWSALFLFYMCNNGITFSKKISACEEEFNGEFLRLAFLTFAFIICYLYGDLLEDFCFNDLDRKGWLWHNWAFFWHPFSLVGSSYAWQHLHYGHEEHGAWRHPNMPALDSLIEKGTSPLHWPVTKFEGNEEALYWVVAFAVISYGLPTLYYQI